MSARAWERLRPADMTSLYHAGFLVIDVQERYRVEVSAPHIAYLALSYVWGPSKQVLDDAID